MTPPVSGTATVYAFSRDAALSTLMDTATGGGIAFESYQQQIGNVLDDVYADGVFLSSHEPRAATYPVSPHGLMRMSAESALTYLLARCRNRGILEFFVREPITKLVGLLYDNGLSFMVGPGTFRDSM